MSEQTILSHQCEALEIIGKEVTNVIASSSLEPKRLIIRTLICDNGKLISTYVVLKGTTVKCDTDNLNVACDAYNSIQISAE